MALPVRDNLSEMKFHYLRKAELGLVLYWLVAGFILARGMHGQEAVSWAVLTSEAVQSFTHTASSKSFGRETLSNQCGISELSGVCEWKKSPS